MTYRFSPKDVLGWSLYERAEMLCRSEDDLHLLINKLLTDHYSWILAHHSPNGGKRNMLEAKKFKAMGTIAGHPDFVLYWRDWRGSDRDRTAFMEVKFGKNKLTEIQKGFRDRAIEMGFPYAEVRTLDQVVDFIGSL